MKYSGVKVWQSHFKEIIELLASIIRNSFIGRLFNVQAVFSNVIEKDMLLKKSWSSQNWKIFIIKYYDISKTYFVHLTCHISVFLFMVLGHQFSIN